jgi:2-polyprenyl-3-methyl-5-hydroxy-6-metoxy-1,4-benzoquinol methylase
VFFCSDSLHGVDPSSLAVRIAREEMGIDIKQGNIENLEYEPSSFELVITYDVLEHTVMIRVHMRNC